MPPKAPERDTREEILNLARELTQTRSFNWLSYQDLSNQLEIRKASIHYHFPTKTDLGVELLKGYRKRFNSWCEKERQKKLTPLQALDAYLDFFRKVLGDADRVCPGGIFSLEWNTLPDEMKSEVKALFADHRRFLEGIIKSGRRSGDIKNTGTVEEQIAFIGAAAQGALQIARIYGSPTTFNMVARQLRQALSTGSKK